MCFGRGLWEDFFCGGDGGGGGGAFVDRFFWVDTLTTLAALATFAIFLGKGKKEKEKKESGKKESEKER